MAGRVAAATVAALILIGLSLAHWDSGSETDLREVGASPVDSPEGTLAANGGSTSAQAGQIVDVDAVRPDTEAARPAAGSSKRTPARKLALSVSLSTQEGAAIREAEVSWVALPEQPLQGRADYLDYLSEHAAVRVSDELGRIEFETPPVGALGSPSVVWITHPDHHAARIELAPHGASALVNRDLVLETAPRIAASVVDGLEQPIEGAEIVQWGIDLGDAEGAGELARLIVRRAATDATGQAPLARLPGRQEITAHNDVGTSAPWVGLAESDVELAIGANFFASGTVNRGAELDPSIEVTIDCFALLGHRRVQLAALQGVTRDWGPIELPLLDADGYLFTLDGPGIVPFDSTLRDPVAGESYSVDLEAAWGQVLWILCTTEDREILNDSQAELLWERDGETTSTTFQAREDGYIFVEGLPEGWVTPILSCPGYATARVLPILLPEEDPVAHEFQLFRAASVSGRVLADGEPVPDFEITVWPTGYPEHRVEHRFTQREEGTFEIPDAESTEILLVASAIGVGVSSPLPLDLRDSAARDLVIDLPTGIRGRGVVIDELTRAPIAGATIRSYAADGRGLTVPLDRLATSGSDGSFELDGLPSGTVGVVASADGYGMAQRFLLTLEDGMTELGAFLLAARQDLTVRVHRDAPTDFTAWSSSLAGPESAGPRPLGSDGVAIFEDVTAGLHNVSVAYGQGGGCWRYVTLQPGTDWSVEFDLRGTCEVRAEIATAKGERVPFGTTIWLTAAELGNSGGRSSYVDDRGGATFSHLLPGTYQLEARESANTGNSILAATTVVLEDGESELVLLDPSRSWPVLRVLDPEGRPVPQVTLNIAVPGSVQQWSVDAQTDAHGRFELTGLEADAIVVGMSHATLGQRIGVQVDTRSIGEPIDLVLDAPADAELILRDPRGPVVGATGSLFDPGLHIGIPGSFSDGNGVLRFHRIAPGNYQFNLDEPGYFPLREAVTVVESGGPIRLAVFRVAELEVQTTTDGLPRPDTEIELVRVDNGDEFAAYLERGLVESSTGALRTGQDGKLVLTGVPEGQLYWRVTGSGTPVEGYVQIQPESGNTLRVEVP